MSLIPEVLPTPLLALSDPDISPHGVNDLLGPPSNTSKQPAHTCHYTNQPAFMGLLF